MNLRKFLAHFLCLLYCCSPSLLSVSALRPRLRFHKLVCDEGGNLGGEGGEGYGGSGGGENSNICFVPNIMKLQFFLKDTLLYKPPVGIVAIAMAVRLVISGRLFRLHRDPSSSSATANEPSDNLIMMAGGRRREYHKRALSLDPSDTSYDSQGGVEDIRRKLCLAILQEDIEANKGENDRDSTWTKTKYAAKALEVTYRSGVRRSNYIAEIVDPLSRLETELLVKSGKVSEAETKKDLWSNPESDEDVIIHMAAKLAEIRALDALLRLMRDRLLTTTLRLKRLQQHWENRVQWSESIGKLIPGVSKNYMEGDQMRLAFAIGALQAEMNRLGLIQQSVMSRPNELIEKDLIEALALTRKETKDPTKLLQSQKRNPLSIMSRWTLRFNAEGRGGPVLRVYSDETSVSKQSALRILLEKNVTQDWMEEAHQWTSGARKVVRDVLLDSLHTNLLDGKMQEDVEIINSWSTPEPSSNMEWSKVLSIATTIDEHRRVGEGQNFGIGDISIYSWIKKFDLFGIPSALAAVGLARLAHNRILPLWPEIKKVVVDSFDVVRTVVEKRIIYPFKEILIGLTSKSDPTLMKFLDPTNEITSLDTMLKDLGFGDGTEATRELALQLASAQYVKDINSGLFQNVLRGRLIKLMLLQIQQLKAGLLYALESIDALVTANRLNVQILAAIPAILLVTLGTRFFFQSLYTLQLRDLRPMRHIHREMKDYLHEMEKGLLLTGGLKESTDMGEFLLHMHSYLVLLDMTPFPNRPCHSIHCSLQEVLVHADVGRQIQLLKLVQTKHEELVKYI